MRIAYLGHSFHRKTGSNSFFLNLLRELGSVDVYWDHGWLGKDPVDPQEILGREYELIVLYQTERHAKILNDSGRRVVFIPMYDSCLPFPHSFWQELTAVDILCFCRTLFERLRGWGLHAKYTKFFPDPGNFEVNTEQEYAGFFWQRREELSWKNIQALVEGSQLSWINIHQAPDFDSASAMGIPTADQELFRLRFSKWTEDRTAYDRALQSAGIYFAPRLHEGIGMSFLEAMAMGKAVVAPDNPTMNEYITNNVNGYLFNPDAPRPISLAHFRTMGRMARQTVERGYPRWVQSREQIASWLVTRRWPQGRPSISKRRDDTAKISVISVLPTDCRDVEEVRRSVHSQTYSSLEHILIGSSLGVKADISCSYISVPRTTSRSEMMNISASRARGEWIIFLNPGDTLFDENALAEALEGHPPSTDFIVGHYLEMRGRNESMRWVAEFEESWERISTQAFDPHWLARLPALSAILINRRVVQEHRFSKQFDLAVGIDFIFRRKRAGARIRHANTTIARIRGDSLEERLKRIGEYGKILSRETANSKRVRAFCASLRDAECQPPLRSWMRLGPSGLCVRLIQNPAIARYAVARAWTRLRFLGIRGILLRQFLWFRSHARKGPLKSP